MAKKFSEKMQNLSAKLADLSDKAAAVSADAKAAWDLRDDLVEERISTAKGNVAALEENIRIAAEEKKSKMGAALLKAKMTVQTKAADHREARDKRLLENCIVVDVNHALDCYDAAALLIAEAELSILEAVAAADEYRKRYSVEPEVEDTEAEA